MDIVITVCDNAAGESCPVYGRNLVRVHWGVPDPLAVNGSDSDVRRAYTSAFLTLRKRIELMLALPVENLDLAALQSKLQEIADVGVP